MSVQVSGRQFCKLWTITIVNRIGFKNNPVLLSQNNRILRPINKQSILGSFEEIYTQNYKAVFRIARKVLGNDDDASDIAQEVFICLFQRLRNGSRFN